MEFSLCGKVTATKRSMVIVKSIQTENSILVGKRKPISQPACDNMNVCDVYVK